LLGIAFGGWKKEKRKKKIQALTTTFSKSMIPVLNKSVTPRTELFVIVKIKKIKKACFKQYPDTRREKERKDNHPPTLIVLQKGEWEKNIDIGQQI